MNKLMEKMMKAGSVTGSSLMSESVYFNDKENTPTALPIINIAFSGEVDKGFTSGLTIISGESKTFKTNVCLYSMKYYMDKHPDAIGIIYDTEYGISLEGLRSFGIDASRILHVPVEHIEQLKFDMVKKMDEIKRGDKVFIMVDSIGQISSKKETDDAIDEKSVADMTRAKAIRSLLRLVTLQLVKKDVPCFMVNHVYMEIGCLEGSTLIKTPEGLVEIRNISVGDMVFTNTGLREVLHTFGPKDLSKEGKTFLELEFDDGSKVKCTGNHKFLLKDNSWVEAKDLRIGSEFSSERTLKSVSTVEEFDLYDITVDVDSCFELSNGVVAHNSMYPKTVIPGGTSVVFSANSVFVITKSQEKDGTELAGWNFNMGIYKSRTVKEKSRLPIRVMYNGGIAKYSGILDLALESGDVVKPSNGWYALVDPETGEIGGKVREKDTDNDEFLGQIITRPKFKEWVKTKYKLSNSAMIQFDEEELAE